MKKIFKLYLLFSLFCALAYPENIGAYLGTPPSSSITAKKGDFVLTLGDSGKKIVFEMKNMNNIRDMAIAI